MAAENSGGKRRRGGGFRKASEEARAILSPVFRKRGFAQTDIITQWPQIVGPTMADQCRPERLMWPRDEANADGATLHMVVAHGWATEVQHLEPVIVERVNRFFGWRAVTRLKLRQANIEPWRRKETPKRRPLTEAERAELERLVAGVSDPRLKESLRQLGETIFTTEGPAT